MITLTRRPITPAVSARTGDTWRGSAACASVGRDAFYDGSVDGQKTARQVCVRCPVLMQCLSGTAAEEAWSQDRWGMAAGLTAPQRLALVWEERLHGARPDVTKAGQLIGWDWMRKLRHLHEQRLTLDEITRAIGGTTPQHLVTTRLALWWLDLDGTRAQLRADGELTPKWQRVADAHGPEIARVLKAGGNRFDVSAYLGVSVSCAEKAITFVNKSMVAALEVAA